MPTLPDHRAQEAGTSTGSIYTRWRQEACFEPLWSQCGGRVPVHVPGDPQNSTN